MFRLAVLLMALNPITSAAQDHEPAADPPVLSSTSLPASVLPHCLYGLDPHDQAVQPWPKGPEPRGYRVTPSTHLHLLGWLGFEAGDILTSVNEQPLGSAEDHFQARRVTQDARTCRWGILRAETPAVLETTITPTTPSELVLERDGDGLPTVLSREAVWQRLSNPYAFGRYASVLAMSADDGVYAVDKGLVALMGDLGFQPLDHHLSIAGVPLTGGVSVLEGLEHLLTDKKVRWEYQRGGQKHSVTFVLRGDAVALPRAEPPSAPAMLELPAPEAD
jgi:hypothetical protein